MYGYYLPSDSNVSASIDDDGYFRLLLWNAWDLAKDAEVTKGRRAGFTRRHAW